MHILTFLAICLLILAVAATLFFWLTDRKAGQPRKYSPGTKARRGDKASTQGGAVKIIRVNASDAVDSFICAVVGESFRNDDGQDRQQIIRRLAKVGMQAHLEREPENPHDHNAVAVFIGGHQIGYLKSDVAERLADKVDGGNYAAGATVHAVTGGTKSKPHFGITLEATVYLLR